MSNESTGGCNPYVKSQIDRLKAPGGEIEFEYQPMVKIRSAHGETNFMNVDRMALDLIILALHGNYQRKRDGGTE